MQLKHSSDLAIDSALAQMSKCSKDVALSQEAGEDPNLALSQEAGEEPKSEDSNEEKEDEEEGADEALTEEAWDEENTPTVVFGTDWFDDDNQVSEPTMAVDLSFDQKPSWFNNAGLRRWRRLYGIAKKGGSQPSVRENFAHTRQRYSILTAVHSWGHTDPVCAPDVPPIHVYSYLLRSAALGLPSGSYKSVDVVEALDWMLPDAADSSESIILMLDWYSGHLTEEVVELVRRKGHVLIFHGGGCTPFMQINDTHLHSRLAF